MKKPIIFVVLAFTAFTVVTVLFWFSGNQSVANQEFPVEGGEPDMPGFLRNAKNNLSKEEFLTKRWEGIALKRGLSKGQPFDPSLRVQAIEKMERQEEKLAENAKKPEIDNSLLAAWVPIGPAPIPNGQTNPTAAVSGRVISIAVHPTNANIVYVGTAQGGVYRTTNGGTNWTPIMDSAVSLAIGSIAISPSNPETVYVGTGEPNSSLDSYFGYGIYRIDNASTTANLTGPLGFSSFGGNSISRIIVHPTNPAIIFVSSSGGNGGLRPTSVPGPNKGIYRSANATSAAPTFEQFGFGGSFNVRDMAIDPTDPNVLVVSVIAAPGTGGLYRITDALAASPATLAGVLAFDCTNTGNCNGELVAQRSGGAPNATFYVATGSGGGQVWVSTDGGATWTMQIDNNFCGGQCFYDIAVAVDPTNSQNVYLGGDPSIISARSTNSGLSFTDNNDGVHGDTHALTVAPSSPNIVYLGTDGGIYKSTNSGVNWTPLNNSQFSATQFMSIDVHPTDPNFTIGGTQDNGTNFYQPNGTWNRIDFGDGGYAVIDQNATNTTNVRMYHTYFNGSTLQGYGTVSNTGAASDGNWTFRGCSNGNAANGISCTAQVNFYAPLERGPGTPNTIYYGTDRLYRSADEGVNNATVSQDLGSPVSSIGISPQNDNVRIVGLNDGSVGGTTTGSTNLITFDPNNTIPDVPINRTIIDPNSQNTAYVTLSAFGTVPVYKTTNLSGSPPTWTNASGTGNNSLPQVPVNAFVVDQQNSNNLYAGTDIGVYASTDGGANWVPFGTGLPRVAVFGMAITNATSRKLRIATHGRGMYEIPLSGGPPTLKAPFDYDGDGKTDISIFRPNLGQWWTQRSSNLVVTANTFGVSSDTLVPADFTGDGKVDIAFWRPSTGEWFVLRSEDNSFFAFPFGGNGDIPTPGDFDGDGTADAAVFRPSNSIWFINNSGGGQTIQAFGVSGDVPIAQDFDGDGKTDLAVYRPSLSQWFFQRSSDLSVRGFQFGANGDKASPLDFTGDGKADIAFFRPNTGMWFVLRSEDNSFFSFPFGTSTDIPVPGDYDGDGKADAAVFRPGNVTWFINGTQAGFIIQAFGIAGDKPTPNAYVR